MDKPSNEVMKDLQEHKGWEYVQFKIKKRMEDCKNRLLSAKSFIEVQKIQAEYETCKTILNLVNKS